jgi:hypothetical protein
VIHTNIKDLINSQLLVVDNPQFEERSDEEPKQGKCTYMAYNTQKKTIAKGLNRTEGTEILSGTFYWTRLGTPLTEINTKEGKKQVPPQYKLTLGLSAAGEKKARELGLYVSKPSESVPQPSVTMSRKVKDDDAEKSRPRVIDENNDPIGPEVLIGNGSTGQVLFRTFGGEEEGSFKGAAILGAQILDLVEYVAPKKDDAAPKGKAPAPKARTPVTYGKKPDPVSDTADLDDSIPF